mgnify:CR=1 FL=1
MDVMIAGGCGMLWHYVEGFGRGLLYGVFHLSGAPLCCTLSTLLYF